MLKKTVTYRDFNDEEVSEDFYFHLSEAELVKLEMSHDGGMKAMLERIVAAEDGKAIIDEFEKIILGSYGQRSPDGRRFIKSQALIDEFKSSQAYSTLFMELVTDADKAAEFVNGLMPRGLLDQATKVVNQGQLAVVPDEGTKTPEQVETVTSKQLVEMSQEELQEFRNRLARGEVKIDEGETVA